MACLAGHGVGPETMAEASRALRRVSAMHGFRIDEVHAPFGPEAMARVGHPLPPATRQVTSEADAILVTGGQDEAVLSGVTDDLDLAAAVTRTLLENEGSFTVFAPLRTEATEWTIERAFLSARAGRCSLVSVGVGTGWQEQVNGAAERHPGIRVRHLSLASALSSLADEPDSCELVLTERALADALAGAPLLRTRRRHVTAHGRLSTSGPGIFLPARATTHEIAGQGVADPSEMLLASALLLGEGLDRRSAADTLEQSLAEALRRPASRLGRRGGPSPAATTRELADLVLVLLPGARRDTEFALGGAA